MTFALLVAACVALLADAWSTRRALGLGWREANPMRRFLVRVLGVNGGTYGVAAVLWLALVRTYSPRFGLAYVALACVGTYLAVRNFAVVRERA